MWQLKGIPDVVPLRDAPLHILRPRFPLLSTKAFLSPFLLFLLPPSLSPSLFSLSATNKLPRHHHYIPWQCWLRSQPQVRAVLPRRGWKFKSSVSSQTFFLGKASNITLLCSRTLDILDKVLVIKCRAREKCLHSLVFLDVRGNNKEPWRRLEVKSVLPGVTWFSVWRLHFTFSGCVMAGLYAETLTNRIQNNVLNLQKRSTMAHLLAPHIHKGFEH